MSDSKDTINMLRPFYRGLPVIIAIMVLSVMAAKKYLNYTTPLYESVVLIKLADAKIGVPNSNLYKDLDVFASTNKIGAEVEMVKSQVVVEKALEHIDLSITAYRIGDLHKTELYDDCPFIITTANVMDKGYDAPFGLTFSNDSNVVVTTPSGNVFHTGINHMVTTQEASFVISRNADLLKLKPSLLVNDRYQFTINSKKKLVDDLKHQLDVVYLDKEVPILRIAYKTPVAEKSADIVNTVSEAYIKDYIEEKFSAADTTVDFLNKEVRNYERKLSSSENAIQVFRDGHKVISLKQESETNLRSIAELKNHRAGLQMDLLAIDSLDNYVKKGKANFADIAPNFQTFNDLLSTELIKKIKSLQTDRHDLLLKYTTANDKVKVVDDKLDDLYNYLGEAVNNTRKNLQIKYDDLSQTIAKEEAAFASFPFKDRNMTVLERNSSMNEQIFRFLHEKRTDAEIARSANISFHRIISRGEINTDPVSPKPTLLKAVALFLGFFGGVSLIYLIHTVKGRINNDNNIQKNSDTPIFARIPFLKNKRTAAQNFEKMAIDLQVTQLLEANTVIAISSFDDGEGKNTIATGLAAAASRLGKKVLLVDAGKGMTKKSGIDTILLSDFNTQWKTGNTIKEILNNWQSSYDLVILKNSPIAEDPSALLLMKIATVNLMVVDTRRTRLKRIEDTDLLRIELGFQNIQFVVNRNGYTPNLVKQSLQIVRDIASKMPFIKRSAC